MTIRSPVNLLALSWARRAFGDDHVYNEKVRGLRIAEEAIELIQANGVPKEKALLLIEIVYAKPLGDAYQELGGVALTSSVYAAAKFNKDIEEVTRVELDRVLAKPVEHFRKRNEEKEALGLTGAV